jgi:glutaryl-CoA dehydrogenase
MNQLVTMGKLIWKTDMKKIGALAQHVDLGRVIDTLGSMDPKDLARMMKKVGGNGKPKEAPAINSDFYDIAGLLTDEERIWQKKLRQFMEAEVRPIINDYWERGEFPHELIPKFARLSAETFGSKPYSLPSSSPTLWGIGFMELARVDPSISTFFGVHWGLSMGSIYLFGSEVQKKKWLPAMQRFEKIGTWALTEPDVGSATAVGLMTTARREGDTWIINGQKKWSGNATFADVNVIWARDVADNQVKGFLVEKDTPGYTVVKLEGKVAMRPVQNVLITLDDVRVPDSNRLPGANSFRDVAGQLAAARVGVAWQATGVAMGAYERALDYANNRIQFGRPITSFQLVQDMLVKMLGNLTAMQTMLLRLSQLEAKHGMVSQEHASLAKGFCGERMRETVAIARGLVGGNGILLEYDVARYFADAEAIYSFEGTHEMQTLIVGRAITGQSAFV